MKIVACDIDGVLADFGSCFQKALLEVTGVNRLGIRANVWDISEAYGITEEQRVEVWESRNLMLHWAAAPMLPRALDLANSLPPGSFYITARGCNLKYGNAIETRKMTIEWLLVHGFPDHTVVFSDDKVSFCDRHGIKIAVDDSPGHVEKYVAAGIKTCMPVYDYNKHLVGHELVYPLHGWR